MKKFKINDVCLTSSNIKWKNVEEDKQFIYVDLTSVDRNSNSIIDPQIITAKTAPSRAQRIIQTDDIIFATTRPTLRRVCIVPLEYDEQICSTVFCILKPNKGIVLPQYLFRMLMSNEFYEYIEPLQAGATYPAVTDKDVRSFEIPVPPLPEQQRIVEFLDTEFAKIDALKANAEKNLQHAKDLFQAALREELQPKEGWEIKKLQEVSEICLGLTHTPKYVDNGVPFISVKDISSGILDLSTTKQISREEFDTFPYGAKPCVGDVLFCRVGTLGKPLIVSQDQPFGIFVSVGFLRPNNKKVKAELLRYWMLSSIFDSQVKKNVVGSTLKNLNTGWLKHFSIPIPPIEIQDSVILNLTLIEERCNALQANYTKTIALCDDMKQALLRKAFSGEL